VSLRLETKRLVIGSFEPRDAEPWLEMVSDSDFGRFVPPPPPTTPETFQRMVKRRHAMERERGYAMWAVDLKEGGIFVGQCGFYPAEGTGRPEVELAYHFDKASWNRGYATEAVRAVLARGLGPVGLDRVMALIVPEHIASCRVAEKAGMRFEGCITAYDIEGLKQYVAERDWWSA